MLATLCACNVACMHGTDFVSVALSGDGVLLYTHTPHTHMLYTHTPLPRVTTV